MLLQVMKKICLESEASLDYYELFKVGGFFAAWTSTKLRMSAVLELPHAESTVDMTSEADGVPAEPHPLHLAKWAQPGLIHRDCAPRPS